MTSNHKYFYEGEQGEVTYNAERMDTTHFTSHIIIEIDSFGTYELFQDFSVRGDALQLVNTVIVKNDLRIDIDSQDDVVRKIIREIAEESEALHIQHMEAEAIELDTQFRKDSKYEFSGD